MCGKLKAMTSSRSIMSVSSGFSVGKMTNLPLAFAGTSIMANFVEISNLFCALQCLDKGFFLANRAVEHGHEAE